MVGQRITYFLVNDDVLKLWSPEQRQIDISSLKSHFMKVLEQRESKHDHLRVGFGSLLKARVEAQTCRFWYDTLSRYLNREMQTSTCGSLNWSRSKSRAETNRHWVLLKRIVVFEPNLGAEKQTYLAKGTLLNIQGPQQGQTNIWFPDYDFEGLGAEKHTWVFFIELLNIPGPWWRQTDIEVFCETLSRSWSRETNIAVYG